MISSRLSERLAMRKLSSGDNLYDDMIFERKRTNDGKTIKNRARFTTLSPSMSVHQTFDDFQPVKVDSVVQRWMTKRIDCIIVSHR
jgi:hypothetical protein